MIRSRFIFCALAIGLTVVGGSALDRTRQEDQGDDEAALLRIVAVDFSRGVQMRPANIGWARPFEQGRLSVDPANCGLGDRGVQWIAAGGRTLFSLHTLLIE